jgi:predicted regulator of Ras-like GTPase activity (Roadblock/LC7/MglB family)
VKVTMYTAKKELVICEVSLDWEKLKESLSFGEAIEVMVDGKRGMVVLSEVVFILEV